MGNPAIARLTMGMAALFLCVGLSACDEKGTTKTKTVTIEKPCDCTRKTAVEENYYPEPPRSVRHHPRKTYKRHYASRHRDHWAPRRHRYVERRHRDDFYAGGYQGESAEIQGRSYSRSYRSSESGYRENYRYYREEEDAGMDREERYSRYSSRSRSSGRWVDGYGRVHYASADISTGPMVINSRQGRSTWHGYGVYCSDPDHRHGEWDDYGYEHRDHSKVGHHFD